MGAGAEAGVLPLSATMRAFLEARAGGPDPVFSVSDKPLTAELGSFPLVHADSGDDLHTELVELCKAYVLHVSHQDIWPPMLRWEGRCAVDLDVSVPGGDSQLVYARKLCEDLFEKLVPRYANERTVHNEPTVQAMLVGVVSRYAPPPPL